MLRQENTLYGEAGLFKLVSRSAEPWQFGIEPGGVASFLSANGFALSDHRCAEALEAAYFQDTDGRRVGRINATHCIVTAAKDSLSGR